VPYFNALAVDDPCKYPHKLYLPETRMIVLYLVLHTTYRIFICLDKTPECGGRADGQAGGQTESFWLLQWSALRAIRTRCKNWVTENYCWYRISEI